MRHATLYMLCWTIYASPISVRPSILDGYLNLSFRTVFWWRHGPEAQSIFVTFASAFLIKVGGCISRILFDLIYDPKLLQPRFASHLSPETRAEIKGLVQKVVELLSSEAIAIDERNGPGLYARFLRNLLQSPVLQDPFPRHLRLTQSTRTTSELLDYVSLAPMSNYSSPIRSGGSPSPLPSQEMTSFDMFAPVGVGATDPYFPGLDTSPTLSYTDATTTGRVDPLIGTMLMPPLNGDDYLFQMLCGGSNTHNWGQSHSK